MYNIVGNFIFLFNLLWTKNVESESQKITANEILLEITGNNKVRKIFCIEKFHMAQSDWYGSIRTLSQNYLVNIL